MILECESHTRATQLTAVLVTVVKDSFICVFVRG